MTTNIDRINSLFDILVLQDKFNDKICDYLEEYFKLQIFYSGYFIQFHSKFHIKRFSMINGKIVEVVNKSNIYPAVTIGRYLSLYESITDEVINTLTIMILEEV